MTWLRYAAWAGMFVFGLAIALLGAVLPLLAGRTGFDLGRAGLLFAALNAAVVGCSLTVGSRIDRRGPKLSMIAGPLCVAAALVVICVARDFGLLLAASTMLGLGGGLLNLSTNTLAAGLNRDEAKKNAELNLLGIFFGLGALTVPLGLGLLLERYGLEVVLLLAAALCTVVGAGAAVLRFPPATPPDGKPVRNPLALLRDPWVAIAASLLFVQAGNEAVLAGFATTHLTRFAGMPAAAWATVGMWAAVVVARAVLAIVARRVNGQAIVVSSAVGTILGSLGLLYATSFAAGGASLVATGAAMAGIFPTMMGMAGARFGGQVGAVFGVVLAVARTGAMLLPWIAGSLAARHGTRAAMATAVVSAGAILLLSLLMSLPRVRGKGRATLPVEP